MREKLAALMHEIWGGWTRYVFEHHEMGAGCVIPTHLFERWSRQMGTPYDELSEKEKDSDRRQADKVLALFGRKTCTWRYEGDYWETTCGGAWEFVEGDPKENNARFCPFCGCRIEEML